LIALAKMESKFSGLEKRMDVKFSEVNAKMAALETRMIWKVVLVNGLLIAALKFIG